MVYVLIFDLKGGNTAQRRRVNRYLVSKARRIQQSAWEFNDMRALETAAKLVAEAGGRTIAFVKSDRLLLDMSEVRQALKEMSYVRHRKKSPVLGKTRRGLKNSEVRQNVLVKTSSTSAAKEPSAPYLKSSKQCFYVEGASDDWRLRLKENGACQL